MHFDRFIALTRQNKRAVKDLLLILAGLLVALYVAYTFDIFWTEGQRTPVEEKIELDEVLLISSLLGVALLVFAARLHGAQQQELARRIAAERQARELAYQDGLTGLPNRRQYEEELATAVAAPPRPEGAHAMLLLDLNGFKKVNDVHGHAVGDELLVGVASRLRSAMRDGDIVARFGGDEFAILATHLLGPEAATSIALRVIEALEAPIEAGGSLHRIGVGIGIALFPADAASGSEALRKADVALYRAKAERRSALRFFEASMDARVMGRAALESALREAMTSGHIQTVFQPNVDLRSGAVVGFEAVPQWVDPARGLMPREQFLSIAEETGLIHALAERTLREACAAASTWPDHVMLTTDLYAGQLKGAALAPRVLSILHESGLAPGRLELEIDEGVLVSDIDGVRSALEPLREAGVRVSLDNFGTGYSSLRHLRNVRFDKVKIDRSLVQAAPTDPECASIVAALAGLGHGFGIQVVAEGIDQGAQTVAALAAGCEQGQGGAYGTDLNRERTQLLATSGVTRMAAS